MADRREGRARRRHRRDVAQGDAAVGCVALVEEDDRGRACGLGIRDLESEAAPAPLDQRDPAGDEAREVVDPAWIGRERRPDRGFREGTVAPARVRARRSQVDVDRGHGWRFTVPRALPVTPPDACVARPWRVLLDRLRDREVELVGRDRPAGRLERVDHVVDARVVSRSPGGARAAVLVRDLLERGLMLADALERHALEQLLVRVVVAVGAACRGCCRGSRQQQRGQCRGHGYEQRSSGDAPRSRCACSAHV